MTIKMEGLEEMKKSCETIAYFTRDWKVGKEPWIHDHMTMLHSWITLFVKDPSLEINKLLGK